MGVPDELRADMSVTDLAYHILKNRGRPIHFRELIQEILQVKAIPVDNPGRIIAQIHTEINLDSRFIHQGNGEWGLRDWQPKGGTKVVRIRTGPPTPPRPRRELLLEEEDLEPEEEPAGEDEEEAEDLEDEGLAGYEAEDYEPADDDEDE